MQSELSRPIVGIENRTAQEVFDIMCDRFRAEFGNEEAPRYTTRRLHEEIRKAEERGRQHEREAALSAAEPSVAVKALEWRKQAMSHSYGLFIRLARTSIGDYQISHGASGKYEVYLDKEPISAAYDKVPEAKAAAQADYEARIRSALSAQVQDVADSPAIKAIAAERARQIKKEGWSPEHDDNHSLGELARAAACYALQAAQRSDETPYEDRSGRGRWRRTHLAIVRFWPWPWGWWKPVDRQRDLEKAGALIAVELDRVIRAAATAKQEG